MYLRRILFSIFVIACALLFQACPKSRNLVYVNFKNNSSREIFVLARPCARNYCDSVSFTRINYPKEAAAESGDITKSLVLPGSDLRLSIGTEEGLKLGFSDADEWFVIFDKEKYLSTDWNNPNVPRDFIVKVEKAGSWDDLLAMGFTIFYP